MREWLQQHQGMATAIAVVVLVVALALVFLRGGGDVGAGSAAYYYDLNTNELFVSRQAGYAPFPTASGPAPDGEPAGVTAMVYGCSEEDCTNPTVEHIAYLLKYTPRGLELADEMDTLGPEDVERRTQLDIEILMNQVARLPGETEWVPITHPKITGIVQEIRRGRCRGSMPVLCSPPTDP